MVDVGLTFKDHACNYNPEHGHTLLDPEGLEERQAWLSKIRVTVCKQLGIDHDITTRLRAIQLIESLSELAEVLTLLREVDVGSVPKNTNGPPDGATDTEQPAKIALQEASLCIEGDLAAFTFRGTPVDVGPILGAKYLAVLLLHPGTWLWPSHLSTGNPDSPPGCSIREGFGAARSALNTCLGKIKQKHRQLYKHLRQKPDMNLIMSAVTGFRYMPSDGTCWRDEAGPTHETTDL